MTRDEFIHLFNISFKAWASDRDLTPEGWYYALEQWIEERDTKNLPEKT